MAKIWTALYSIRAYCYGYSIGRQHILIALLMNGEAFWIMSLDRRLYNGKF